MLRFMGSQRVRHDSGATEQQQHESRSCSQTAMCGTEVADFGHVPRELETSWGLLDPPQRANKDVLMESTPEVLKTRPTYSLCLLLCPAGLVSGLLPHLEVPHTSSPGVWSQPSERGPCFPFEGF